MAKASENLSDPIFHWAQLRPNASAVTHGALSLSYTELALRVARMSAFLHRLGVMPGETVGVAMVTSIDHVVLVFGLIRIGAVPLDMPPVLPPGVKGPLKVFRVDRLFRDGDLPAPAGVIVQQLDASWFAAAAAEDGDHRVVRNADDVHNFSMTSGSTGQPKGVLTTGRQWQARFETAVRMLPEVLSSERPPTLLVIGGMTFSAFFFFLANQLFIGGPLVLMTETANAATLVKTINAWKDAVTLVTPALARQFLTMASNRALFPDVRAFFIGAAPLYPDEKIAVLKWLTPNFHEVYGSAACGFISHLAPDEVVAHADSVGKAAPGVEVAVVDKEGRLLTAGQPGRLRIRGPGISKGFYEESDADLTQPEGFRESWYYPGDIGAMDDEGYIHVRGRVSDVIYRRGIEILPSEVEQIMAAHDSVAEVAVVGVAGKDKDELVIGLVVSRGAIRKPELAMHCRANIPPAKFPDRVFFVKALPKNANGKPDRARLKALARRHLNSNGHASSEDQVPVSAATRSAASGQSSFVPTVMSHMAALNDELLTKSHRNSTLSRGQREMIAAAVAALNGCTFFTETHGGCAVELLRQEGVANAERLLADVKAGNFDNLHPRAKALIAIARVVARDPKQLDRRDTDAANAAGIGDTDINLAIAIASVVSMNTRLFDALRKRLMPDTSADPQLVRQIIERGYGETLAGDARKPRVIKVGAPQ